MEETFLSSLCILFNYRDNPSVYRGNEWRLYNIIQIKLLIRKSFIWEEHEYVVLETQKYDTLEIDRFDVIKQSG